VVYYTTGSPFFQVVLKDFLFVMKNSEKFFEKSQKGWRLFSFCL